VPGLLHSALLGEAGFRHAFFTREGGVSNGPFESLNFSSAVGDEPEAVASNLRLAAGALGVDVVHLCFPSQVHEASVLELYGDETAAQVLCRTADAVVSAHPNVACAIRIADCVPILLADPLTGRVAAIHAGWRGLVRGVIGASAEALGGEPSTWLVAIGPHIRVGAFEVSEDVAAEIEAVCPGADCALRAPGRKPHIDLSRVARWQLQQLGVPDKQVEVLAGCTHAEPRRFFSFRRDGRISGRHLAAIVARRPISDAAQ
jgi:polyphenol oxidase